MICEYDKDSMLDSWSNWEPFALRELEGQ